MQGTTVLKPAALIAIDWGTTSVRAYRLDASGAVLDTRTAPLGVQQVRDGRFDAALDQLLGDWQGQRIPRIACGMIGSRQGWIEAPYVECPAPLSVLASKVIEVPGRALAIVPGIITRDSAGLPDVMRGEETQLAGAVDERERRVLAALPGTHSKWACVEFGRIVDFATFMTGEIWDALLAHTILGRLAEPAPALPGPAYERGVVRGLGAGSLMHDVFGARTLVLAGELTPAEVPDWLSGLMIGREVRNMRTFAHGHGYDGSRVRLIGEHGLVERYALALARADVTVDRAPADAAAIGLWRIAAHAGMLPNQLNSEDSQ